MYFELEKLMAGNYSFMKDLKIKIKRQTEILGLVLARPGEYIIYDFEE